MSKQPLIVGAVSLVSLGIGAFVGYKVAEKRLVDEFEKRLEKETASMRVFYSTVKKPYVNAQEAAADLIPQAPTTESENGQKVAYHKIVKAEGYEPLIDPEEEEAIKAEFDENDQAVVTNVFESKRDRNNPYVISQEEFMQNEPEYTQGTLTYYQLDGILTDDHEDVIEQAADTVGLDAFNHFGLGAEDGNVVHVRNEKLHMDFEIVRSEGSYAQEVLGVDPSPSPRPSARQRRGE